ncbi:madf domain transcription factor [Holotrichia oblita]|uniref:Madf domain transcription factor n=1 Tax=Holotrichia oblita TaxID=644536 RepID=A0ACB9SKN4_HOLOL|nr:madf domain transcription factor [Holotrichia oblita]
MSDQELNMKLVGTVEKYEVLYNYKLPGYSRKDVTEKAWQDVSIELDLSGKQKMKLRKMKPSPSGSGGKKKSYYLENAMQFCLPFIRTVIPPSTGNLPAPPSTTQRSICDTEGSETQVEDHAQLEDESITVQQNSPPTSLSIIGDPPQHQIETPPTSSSLKRTSQITQKKNKSSASVADQSVAEYFKAKKVKLLSNAEEDISNKRVDRQQGIKMFLLSLMPELEELSDSQIKIFKRQVLRVIDDISTSEYHQQPRSSSAFTMLTSPSTESRDSQMDTPHMSNVLGQIHTADFYDAFS